MRDPTARRPGRGPASKASSRPAQALARRTPRRRQAPAPPERCVGRRAGPGRWFGDDALWLCNGRPHGRGARPVKPLVRGGRGPCEGNGFPPRPHPPRWGCGSEERLAGAGIRLGVGGWGAGSRCEGGIQRKEGGRRRRQVWEAALTGGGATGWRLRPSPARALRVPAFWKEAGGVG